MLHFYFYSTHAHTAMSATRLLIRSNRSRLGSVCDSLWTSPSPTSTTTSSILPAYFHQQSIASSPPVFHATSSFSSAATAAPSTSSTTSTLPGHEKQEEETTKRREHEFQHVQHQLLDLALHQYVKSLGWSRASLEAAATDLGLSPAIVGSLPRSPEGSLVEYFNTTCTQKLKQLLVEEEKEDQAVTATATLSFGIQKRLEMIVPYIDTWVDALAIQARPSELATSLSGVATIADVLWSDGVGDKSADAVSWYSKRAVIMGVYTATELSLLSDQSEGYQDTWMFLKRRMEDVGPVVD